MAQEDQGTIGAEVLDPAFDIDNPEAVKDRTLSVEKQDGSVTTPEGSEGADASGTPAEGLSGDADAATDAEETPDAEEGDDALPEAFRGKSKTALVEAIKQMQAWGTQNATALAEANRLFSDPAALRRAAKAVEIASGTEGQDGTGVPSEFVAVATDESFETALADAADRPKEVIRLHRLAARYEAWKEQRSAREEIGTLREAVNRSLYRDRAADQIAAFAEELEESGLPANFYEPFQEEIVRRAGQPEFAHADFGTIALSVPGLRKAILSARAKGPAGGAPVARNPGAKTAASPGKQAGASAPAAKGGKTTVTDEQLISWVLEGEPGQGKKSKGFTGFKFT